MNYDNMIVGLGNPLHPANKEKIESNSYSIVAVIEEKVKGFEKCTEDEMQHYNVDVAFKKTFYIDCIDIQEGLHVLSNKIKKCYGV